MPGSGPQAAGDRVVTAPQTPGATTDLRANDTDPDGDPLVVTAFTRADRGTVVYLGAARFTCTPAAGFVGADAFTYEITDGADGFSAAEVTVLVEP